MSTTLVSAVEDRILLLTFQDDEGLPRIERRVLVQIKSEMARLARDSELLGCVITGTERAFAVGANIGEIAKLAPEEAHEFSREGQSACRAIERGRLPVVAAIRGYCMGGGLDIALACRARVATSRATFAHPGGSLGILTGWGGTQRLPRLIGRSPALEMLTTGSKLDARQALSCGLIDRIASEHNLISRAADIALSMAIART